MDTGKAAGAGFIARVLEIDSLQAGRAELAKIGCDEPGVRIMGPKAVFRAVKIENVPLKAAIILKEEMLARGGEAAVNKGVAALSVDETDVLLLGTLAQYRSLLKVLAIQPFRLKQVGEAIAKALGEAEPKARRRQWRCREHIITLGDRTLVMGILNVTPDSFSDGGRYFEIEAALAHARRLVADGADIIDVGGESTRPGSESVGVEEELRRVLPVVKAIVEEFPRVPVSVDTYRSRVAEACLAAGASIVNDISGFQEEPEIAVVAARYGAGAVLMHRQGCPKEMQVNPHYEDVIPEIIDYLRTSVRIAEDAGCSLESLVIDPGIGFGKNFEHNLEVLRRLSELRALGLPILLGTSRKSFIGRILDLPPSERVEGTIATVVMAIAQGAVDIVRVHDVKEVARAIRVADTIARARRGDGGPSEDAGSAEDEGLAEDEGPTDDA